MRAITEPVMPPYPESDTPPIIKYDDDKHAYWIDGIPTPSVSKILEDTTPKPALPWWGMRVGLAAVVQLLQESEISYAELMTEHYAEILSGIPAPERTMMRKGKAKTRLEAAVIENKLTTNHVKEDAGERGTLIHNAVERIGTHDEIPSMDDYPPELRGYIRAIARWWMEQEPELHRQEVIVGSRIHGFAGRFDLDASYDQYGRALTDFKTSKAIYSSHHEQLRLYEIGDNELGGPDFDDLVVVRLGVDGSYEMESSRHISPDTVKHAVALSHERAYDKYRAKKGLKV